MKLSPKCRKLFCMSPETSNFEISCFEKLVKQKPNYIDALIPLAEVYTKAGFYEKGLKVDKKLVKLRKKDPNVHYNLACSLALTGKTEQSFAALERAMKLGYSDLEHMKQDPDLKSLHSDPRFQELLKKKNRW